MMITEVICVALGCSLTEWYLLSEDDQFDLVRAYANAYVRASLARDFVLDWITYHE